MSDETFNAGATERLWSLLSLGDPGGEAAIAYRIKDRMRDFSRMRDLARAIRVPSFPAEVVRELLSAVDPHTTNLCRTTRNRPPTGWESDFDNFKPKPRLEFAVGTHDQPTVRCDRGIPKCRFQLVADE